MITVDLRNFSAVFVWKPFNKDIQGWFTVCEA